MVAHALLLAAWRLRRIALRPLGWGAMHDMTAFPLALRLRMLVLMVMMLPVIVPAFVPLLGFATVWRLMFAAMGGLRA